MHFRLQKYRIFLYKKTFCLGFYTPIFFDRKIFEVQNSTLKNFDFCLQKINILKIFIILHQDK